MNKIVYDNDQTDLFVLVDGAEILVSGEKFRQIEHLSAFLDNRPEVRIPVVETHLLGSFDREYVCSYEERWEKVRFWWVDLNGVVEGWRRIE